MSAVHASSQDTDSGTARKHRASRNGSNSIKATAIGSQPAMMALFKPYVYRGNEPFVPTAKQAEKINRRGREAEKVLDDYKVLFDQGLTVRQAAAEMGMTFAALTKALERAKQRGDSRARRHIPNRYGHIRTE